MSYPRIAIAIFSMVVAAATLQPAFSQSYPNRPIRIVTSGAGGGNDLMARLIAQGITGPLGQPLVVDNRANVIIIAEAVSQAPADGYTLLFGSSSLWLLPLMQKMSYDAVKDFSPVSMIDRSPNILVVHTSLPVKSVHDLISLAKARPGELNFSYGTPGSSAQLAGELFKSMAGINMVGISYKGTAAQLNAVIAGEVQLTFASATSAIMQQLKSGRLRALAVTGTEPSPLLPGVTTLSAAGLPDYEVTSIDGVLVRAGTPSAAINLLNQEIVRFLNRQEVKERLQSAGVEMKSSSPEQFAAFIKSDVARMTKVVKDADIHLD